MIDWIATLFNKEPEEICREWHCFEIGWAETFCFCIPARFPITDFAKEEMEREFHYYGIGRVAGVLLWVVILVCIRGLV